VKIAGESPVSPDELLHAKEARVGRQVAALKRFGLPLVSITIVMPGPVKTNWPALLSMRAALREIDALIFENQWPLLLRKVLWENTGPEALFVVDANTYVLKSFAIDMEDGHPLGRLWDLDVITMSGTGLSRGDVGRPPRQCLLCHRPARECGRCRLHSTAELLRVIRRKVDDFEHHRKP
jgi:holo-ACP synthase